MTFSLFRKKAKPSTTERLSRLIPKMLDAYGALMEHYPTAILDTSRLPFPKADMKLLLKIAWLADPSGREPIEYGYIHLAHFQDGIGDKPIDCNLPADGDLAKAIAVLGPYVAISEKTTQEMKLLLAEWQDFKRRGVMP
jgi:hypothetical protein